MYIEKMGYVSDWAGPGLGYAVTAEIAFSDKDEGSSMYVSFDDGPMGPRYDVTTKSVLDIMSGESKVSMEESDFLESYTTFEATQKHSKYAFVFSELEALVQRAVNINQYEKEYAKSHRRKIRPYELKLTQKRYKKYAKGLTGDLDETEMAHALYKTIDGVIVELDYRKLAEGGVRWGCYNDARGSVDEYDTFEETQSQDCEERDGFKLFRAFIKEKRSSRK